MPSSRRIGGMPLPPAPTWNDMFYELLKFRAYTGHCIVPKSYPLLYSWVLTQRQLKLQQAQKSKNRERRTGIKNLTDPATKGILTKERIKVLDSVGFVWGLPVDNVEWQKKFEELVWYKHQYGHWNVPIFSDLGRWVCEVCVFLRRDFLLYNPEEIANVLFPCCSIFCILLGVTTEGYEASP